MSSINKWPAVCRNTPYFYTSAKHQSVWMWQISWSVAHTHTLTQALKSCCMLRDALRRLIVSILWCLTLHFPQRVAYTTYFFPLPTLRHYHPLHWPVHSRSTHPCVRVCCLLCWKLVSHSHKWIWILKSLKRCVHRHTCSNQFAHFKLHFN